MKICKRLCFINAVLSLIFVVSACDKPAHTVEYYETHEKERIARCEECKKMIPTDMLADKDCQAAFHSWSTVGDKKEAEERRNRTDPMKQPPKGKGFIQY